MFLLRKSKLVIKESVRNLRYYLIRKNPKIFCIGMNKTGTTTLKYLLHGCGVLMGDQRKAELLTEDFLAGNHQPILEYCKSARGFQDVPFSLPGAYKILHKTFPDAKFVLTCRDTPEQWYQSVINFSIKLHGKLPTVEELKSFDYVNTGWSYRVLKALYGDIIHTDLYNIDIRINLYKKHLKETQEFFSGTGKLCVVNVARQEDFNRLIEFLDLKCPLNSFPVTNVTADPNTRT